MVIKRHVCMIVCLDQAFLLEKLMHIQTIRHGTKRHIMVIMQLETNIQQKWVLKHNIVNFTAQRFQWQNNESYLG